VKISKIAQLSVDAITEEVIALSESNKSVDIHVDRLIVSMLDLDELHFEKVLSDIVIKFGFERVVTEILYLFLEKIGVLWITGNILPAHEHFITSLIRQKMLVAIDSLPITTDPKARKVMLFLPETELHEIGLLFYSYLYKKHGYKTIYLGQSVPFEDLVSVDSTHDVDVVFGAIVTNPLNTDLKGYITQLSESFKEKEIILTGAAAISIDFDIPENVRIIKDSKEGLEYIV
jgi:methanogenic corrinoid protein MtbC1